MFDVIEHIPALETYMPQVFRILKPGGWLVFQTPNKYINRIYETIHTRSFTIWKKYHCSLQSPASLRKLLMRSGFAEIRIEKYTIKSEYNLAKLRAQHIPFPEKMMDLADKAPLALFPNMWGSCQKPE